MMYLDRSIPPEVKWVVCRLVIGLHVKSTKSCISGQFSRYVGKLVLDHAPGKSAKSTPPSCQHLAFHRSDSLPVSANIVTELTALNNQVIGFECRNWKIQKLKDVVAFVLQYHYKNTWQSCCRRPPNN